MLTDGLGTIYRNKLSSVIAHTFVAISYADGGLTSISPVAFGFYSNRCAHWLPVIDCASEAHAPHLYIFILYKRICIYTF